MNILIFTQYFWPENFRINEITNFLNKKLNKIDILTTYPSYPKKRIYKNYLKNKKILGKRFGSEIFRFYSYPRNNSNFSIILNIISFTLIAPFYFLSRMLKKKYDVIFLFCPSPIISIIPIIILNYFFKKKIIIWVLDLWPETLVDLNIISNKWLIKIIDYLIKYIYLNSEIILCQSKSFQKSISQKLKRKTYYFPAWPEEEVYKIKNKKKIYFIKKIKSFKILFAGNIGEAQSFNSLIKCAIILKSKKIPTKFIILGDGRGKVSLIKNINKFKLNDYFELCNSVPPERITCYFNSVDALYLSLKKKNTFKKTIPGKLQTYLFSGKPILGMISGEANKIIRESSSGLVCEADDFKMLSNNIIKMISFNKNKLKSYGKNGKKYANKFFNKEKILNDLIKIIYSIK